MKIDKEKTRPSPARRHLTAEQRQQLDNMIGEDLGGAHEALILIAKMILARSEDFATADELSDDIKMAARLSSGLI